MQSARLSSKVLRRLAGIAAAVAAFFGIAAAVIELGSAWAAISHPGDPSAGDPVAWGLVFLSPILIPLDLFASAAVGVIVFTKLTQRR